MDEGYPSVLVLRYRCGRPTRESKFRGRGVVPWSIGPAGPVFGIVDGC